MPFFFVFFIENIGKRLYIYDYPRVFGHEKGIYNIFLNKLMKKSIRSHIYKNGIN